MPAADNVSLASNLTMTFDKGGIVGQILHVGFYDLGIFFKVLVDVFLKSFIRHEKLVTKY